MLLTTKNTKIHEDLRKIDFLCFFLRGPSNPSWCKLQNEAFYAVFEASDVEVYQQARFDACELHIRQNLRLVYRHQFVHGLELYDERLIDKQVDAIAAVELRALVFDGQLLLHLMVYAGTKQLKGQAPLVGRFQKPRSQLLVKSTYEQE